MVIKFTRALAENDTTYLIESLLIPNQVPICTALHERGITYKAAGKWHRLVNDQLHTSPQGEA